MTTEEIDCMVHHEIIGQNAYPSPLGYGDFPKSVCTSVNNVVCHGIPDSRPLQDGDIINIDVTEQGVRGHFSLPGQSLISADGSNCTYRNFSLDPNPNPQMLLIGMAPLGPTYDMLNANV
ncbi:UNVERIFIED_CONTAM: hypothetical protein K2H54_041953 [Gekko kuhli]